LGITSVGTSSPRRARGCCRSVSGWWSGASHTSSLPATSRPRQTIIADRYTTQGILATLRQTTAVPIGIYSTSYQWSVITGGYQAPVDANRVATGQRAQRAKPYCASTGFTGAKKWLF